MHAPPDGEMGNTQLENSSAAKNIPMQRRVLDMYNPYFSMKRLQQRETLPPTLDFSKLETYLDEEEFLAEFGMALSEFEKLAPWKKTALKQKAGLF